MTIDERLEKLTERHEALTMSVELFSRDFQLTLDRIGGEIDKLVEVSRRDGEHILALARVAEAHEHRLQRIEDVQ